jgi:hypothetical protein
LGDRRRSIIRTVQRFGYSFGGEVISESIHLLVQGDREFRLVPGENVVGRDPKADVTIASTTVSRRHAIITIEGNQATLVDLQSKNGTRVAGREVLEPTRLFDGAVNRRPALAFLPSTKDDGKGLLPELVRSSRYTRSSAGRRCARECVAVSGVLDGSSLHKGGAGVTPSPSLFRSSSAD